MFPLRRPIVAASTKLICVCCGGNGRSTSFCRSRGQTQQWPTELTGRGSSYWLSIHRSSPRVPGWPDQSRGGGGGCVWWISAGNSTSTGTHTQLPHGVAVTCSVHQKTLTNLLPLPSGPTRSRSRRVLEICAIWGKRGIKAKRRHRDGQVL